MNDWVAMQAVHHSSLRVVCSLALLACAALGPACAPAQIDPPRAHLFDPLPISLERLPHYDELRPLGVSADGRAMFEGRNYEPSMLIDVLLVEANGPFTILVKDRHEEGFPDVIMRASLGDGRYLADIALQGQTATRRVLLNEDGEIDPGGAMCGEVESEDGRELLLELVEVSADGRSAVFGIPVEPRSEPFGTVGLFAPTEPPRFEDFRICADGRSEPLTPPSPEADLFALLPGGTPLWRTNECCGANPNSFWYGSRYFEKTALKAIAADGHALVCLPPVSDPDESDANRQCQNAIMGPDEGDPIMLPTSAVYPLSTDQIRDPYQNWSGIAPGPLAHGGLSLESGASRMVWTPATGALALHEAVAYDPNGDRALMRALRSNRAVWPFAQHAVRSGAADLLVCLQDCASAYILKRRTP